MKVISLELAMTGFGAYQSVHIGEWLRLPKGPLRMRDSSSGPTHMTSHPTVVGVESPSPDAGDCVPSTDSLSSSELADEGCDMGVSARASVLDLGRVASKASVDRTTRGRTN